VNIKFFKKLDKRHLGGERQFVNSEQKMNDAME
jgi:hypothetical protein